MRSCAYNVITISKRKHKQSVCFGLIRPEKQPVTDGAAMVQTTGEGALMAVYTVPRYTAP